MHLFLDDLFFIVRCGKLPTPWGSNCSSSNTIHWEFSCLSRFSTNSISLHLGEAKWKDYRDQGRLTFLAPVHQTPSRRIALLFAACSCDSKVSLLPGYSLVVHLPSWEKSWIHPWCKGMLTVIFWVVFYSEDFFLYVYIWLGMFSFLQSKSYIM